MKLRQEAQAHTQATPIQLDQPTVGPRTTQPDTQTLSDASLTTTSVSSKESTSQRASQSRGSTSESAGSVTTIESASIASNSTTKPREPPKASIFDDQLRAISTKPTSRSTPTTTTPSSSTTTIIKPVSQSPTTSPAPPATSASPPTTTPAATIAPTTTTVSGTSPAPSTLKPPVNSIEFERTWQSLRRDLPALYQYIRVRQAHYRDGFLSPFTWLVLTIECSRYLVRRQYRHATTLPSSRTRWTTRYSRRSFK